MTQEVAEFVDLPRQEFERLLAGDFTGEGPTLQDVSGNLVLQNGEPLNGTDQIWANFTQQRGFIFIERVDGGGKKSKGYLWLTPQACLVSALADEDTHARLALSPLESRFTLLIDLLGIGRRTNVSGGEPGTAPIDHQELVDLVEVFEDPEASAQARNNIAASVAKIAPDSSADLRNSQFQLVTMAAEWDQGDRNEATSLIYFDTPSGYLFLSEERKMLRKQQVLERAPGWFVFAQAVGSIAPVEAIENW